MAGDDLREDHRVLEPEALDALLLENYALVGAAHEQQNKGRYEDALEYQRRIGANLQAVVDAMRAAGVTVTLREPTGGGGGDDDDGGLAQTAAADARALSAAAGGVGAGAPAAATTSGAAAWLPAAAAAEQPQSQQQQQQGAGQASDAGAAAPAAAPQQQQQQQQQQLPPAARPPPWLADVDRPADALLAALGLIEHAPVLAANGVDLAALRLLSREDLRGLGLSLGAAVKIEAALRDGSGGGGGGNG